MNMKVEHVRLPDEFREVLDGIMKTFETRAQFSADGLLLSGLSKIESAVVGLFRVTSEVDEVVDNLNMAVSDLIALGGNPKVFHDKNPTDRYKFLMRMWFYEFGRFEDLWGYYTLWLEHHDLLTKSERKAERASFYEAYEALIQLRNRYTHDKADWAGQITPEMSLLGAAESVGYGLISKDGGAFMSWHTLMAPLCDRMAKALYEAGMEMRVTWNMALAEAASDLVAKGELTKSKKAFEPAAPFLKPGRPDR